MSDATVTGPGLSSGGDTAPTKTGHRARGLSDFKELGGQLASAARNGANSLYEEQRNRAAEEISALGNSLQRSVKSLDGTIGEVLAPYAETAAKQVGDFAGTLRARSLSQVGSDVEGLARQWPMAFLAAAVGAGFLAGRFLLSSGNPVEIVAGNHSGTPASGRGAGGGSTLQRDMAASEDKRVSRGTRPGTGGK